MTGERKHAAAHRRQVSTASRFLEHVCKVIGHDEEKVSSGDVFCHRCHNTLGRWRP